MFRTERDPLGQHQVPADAYYGIQTVRAAENFPISGLRASGDLVTATVLIKRAAAQANVALGRVDGRIGGAVITAADEILGGSLRDQFIVDVYQAGAGTSHNMNTNEVLANRAAEILGGMRGEYTLVHPNDHVNMGQSTNDVFPTATRVALLIGHRPLVDELNVMMPVIAWNALHASTIVRNAMDTLRERCVDGITADEARCRELMDRSTAVATALSPYIGYAKTAEVAKESVKTGTPIRDIVLERKLLDPKQLDDILSAEAMTQPGVVGRK